MHRITPRQVRAARALLEWSQEMLAEHAIVSRNSVYRFEDGKTIKTDMYFKIIDALQAGGIEFQMSDRHKGEGVRLKEPSDDPRLSASNVKSATPSVAPSKDAKPRSEPDR